MLHVFTNEGMVLINDQQQHGNNNHHSNTQMISPNLYDEEQLEEYYQSLFHSNSTDNNSNSNNNNGMYSYNNNNNNKRKSYSFYTFRNQKNRNNNNQNSNNNNNNNNNSEGDENSSGGIDGLDVDMDDDEPMTESQLVHLIKNSSSYNRQCADCLSNETEWASVNLGIYLCIHCSGIHRSLGTHISKVRSLSLDVWEREHVIQMSRIGNLKSNAYWECNVFPFEKPLSSDTQEYRRQFIISKYIHKKFIPTITATTIAHNHNDSGNICQNHNHTIASAIMNHMNNSSIVGSSGAAAQRVEFELTRRFPLDSVQHFGWITKQGLKTKNWKRRYAILKGNVLTYFANKSSPTPKGQFIIEPSSSIISVDSDEIGGKRNCFAIVTKNRNYYMYCSDGGEERSSAWIYALRASVYYNHLTHLWNDPNLSSASVSTTTTPTATTTTATATMNANALSGSGEDNNIAGAQHEKEGALTMRVHSNPFTHQLKPRFCRLHDCWLSVYMDSNTLDRPLDIVTLKGATLLSTADFKVKKECHYSMSIFSTHNKQQYMFYADNEQDWKEWSQALDACIMDLSEERVIHENSTVIHNHVLKMIHRQQDKQQQSSNKNESTKEESNIDDVVPDNVSPHSPYYYSKVNFHRSIPLSEATKKRIIERIMNNPNLH